MDADGAQRDVRSQGDCFSDAMLTFVILRAPVLINTSDLDDRSVLYAAPNMPHIFAHRFQDAC